MSSFWRRFKQTMKTSFFLLCVVATIQALPRLSTSPFFTIRNGVLERLGHDSKDLNDRIVGGSNAEPGSAPWMVSLQWGVIRPAHFCGGSIINPNWIVTAGHCAMAFRPYGISTVVAGLHDLNNFSGIEQIRHVTLSNIWIHEEYNGLIGPHDIGMMVFQTPFVFDWSASPIALPEPDEIHSGIARLHGWGSTSGGFFPVFPNILQTADKPIIPVEICRANWFPNHVDDTHMCAGLLEGGVSACTMDNGGALTQDGEMVGIVSWGVLPCGLPTFPTVYVRISAYISWMQDIIDRV